MYIDSTSNKIVKHTKKLLDNSGRKEFGQFVIEGKRLVLDAIKCGAEVSYVLVKQGSAFGLPEGIVCHELSEKAFSALKTTVNSQGIMAVVNMEKNSGLKVSPKSVCLYIYLDGISDPGNMGTIIRTSDALNADGIILSGNCVDVYNPKVVRSTMASIFNTQMFFDDSERSMLKQLKENSFKIIAGSLQAEKSLYDIDFKDRCVIVVGNEANGISDEVVNLSNEITKIPILGSAESLNAAVACAVMGYEFLRQNL